MLSFKLPENDSRYEWTNHVKDKMVYYGISSSLIKRVVRFPKRKEGGIAPGTTAVMQPRGSARTPQEVWVMYKELAGRASSKSQTGALNKLSARPSTYHISALVPNPNFQTKKRIISAWRYPGISPVGKKIPIPDEILQELESII